ncbi:MAG: DNA alkylation repair protein [Sphingobium sp.]|nr:DNA alkylation repair protein [Sphingobium sp.]
MTMLQDRLLAALRNAAEPARAPAMQAYMKSAMPYLGVQAVPLRVVCKAVFGDLSYADSAAWQADVLAIWRGAAFREERYAAIELTGVRAARAFQMMGALALYQEMIVTGAWWDYVDVLASQRLWAILKADPRTMKPAMLAWAKGADMWKARSAILCQLNAKDATDRHFLRACIKPSLASNEFFLRKAIGWALRQYARTDPDWVRDYVTEHDADLSPLSKREAMKHLA